MTEADEKLFNQLSADPIARQELLKHAKRLNPEMPIPEVDTLSALETRIKEQVEPYKKELAELKEQLGKKMSTDMLEQRRDAVRAAPYFLNDDQITELEGRMIKDKNMYGDYVEALKYYQYQDQPTHPTGVPTISPFNGRNPGGEDWRQLIKDPKSKIWDKQERKKLNQENWKKASAELSRTRR